LWKRDDRAWQPFATKLETADTLEAVSLNHARAIFLSRPLQRQQSNPARNQYLATYDGVNFPVYMAKDKHGNTYVSNAHPAR
jgi:hypothetical protein